LRNRARSTFFEDRQALVGRTAAYTGKPVTWEETYRSREAWEARINLDRL
jgi:hypothetical protein